MSPPTKQTANHQTSTGIDDLPPEMICELFEYLPLQDLLACSMVNKRWNSIYAGFKVHRLVADENDYPHIHKWHDSNQRIRQAERCRPWILRRLAEKPLLSNLKYLALCDNYGPVFDLDTLNQFQQLVHLEISVHNAAQVAELYQLRLEQISIDDLVAEVDLNLPKLKVLAFNNYAGPRSLSIDCPLLSTLAYYGEDEENRLEVKQPETIRKLKTDMIGANLTPFKNVECLITNQFEAINQTTLLVLPNLRELSYTVHIERVFCDDAHNGSGTIDRVKRTLSEFLDEAKKLRGSDFRFNFCGFQLTNVNVEQIDFGVQVDSRRHERVSWEYIYMKNYHLIEPGALHFVSYVDYTRLLSEVTGEFPRCFSKKFSGIEWVKATAEVQDADQFLWFLKSLRFLRSLEIKPVGFSQEFYDQLPSAAPSLGSLNFIGDVSDSELQFNFDFIGKFPCLSSLQFNPFVSLQSLPSLVRWLGKSKSVRFGVRSRVNFFLIRKSRDSKKWTIETCKQLLETEDPNHVINFCKGSD